MEQKKTEFNKVFNAWDILVIAFGAMIGWGWVVSSDSERRSSWSSSRICSWWNHDILCGIDLCRTYGSHATVWW